MLINTAKLKKMIRDVVHDNHKTTLMSIDSKLRKMEFNSIVALRQEILKASPLQVFGMMSVEGFFKSNEYVVKDKEFNSPEKDILYTLLENIRFEFGSEMIMKIIDRDTVPKVAFENIYKNKHLVAAYLLAIYKDLIIIEAENVAIMHLSSFQQTTIN